MKRLNFQPYGFTLLVSMFTVGHSAAQSLADYQSEVLNQSPSEYFQLDNSLESAINATTVLTPMGPDGGFTFDVFGNPNNSYFFVVNNDELSNEVDPIINTSGTASESAAATGSITFLFRSLSGFNESGERWLFDGRGLLSGAGTDTGNGFGLYFERTNDPERTDPGSLKLVFGDTTTAILPAEDIKFSAWYYFALTYDESRAPNKAIWYLGRAGDALSVGMTTNAADAVAGDGLGLFVGNRSTTGGGFRSPGNGRIDEFAVWDRELSAAEIESQFAKLPTSSSNGVEVTNLIVDDSFEDGDRAATGDLQADWWSSSSTGGNSVEAYPNQLGLVTGTSGRGIHGTFAPQNLEIGDTIRVTYTFTTPATVGSGRSTAFKVALMDFNNPDLAADLSSSSSAVNPLYTELPGYMVDFDVNTDSGSDISIRKHENPNDSGRFLGTTGEWDSFGSSPDAGYVFTPDTEYQGVFSITRSDFDSVDIFSSLSQGETELDSHTEGDSSAIANNFGMLGFWVNSNSFGSTNERGEEMDNGITFSNIKIEVITFSTPPTQAPALNISTEGGDVILSWLTEGSDGYNLESSPSLTTPEWSSHPTPPVVEGDSNTVTDPASEGEKYYRLAK